MRKNYMTPQVEIEVYKMGYTTFITTSGYDPDPDPEIPGGDFGEF